MQKQDKIFNLIAYKLCEIRIILLIIKLNLICFNAKYLAKDNHDKINNKKGQIDAVLKNVWNNNEYYLKLDKKDTDQKLRVIDEYVEF
jgi:hypothetical protein